MNKSYWNKYYSKNLGLQEQTSFAIHVLNMMSAGDAILELGCGNGRDSFFFASHGIQVYALDQSEIVINQIKGENINPRFICEDLLSINENFAYEINNGKKKNLNCKKINSNEIIGLENSGTTPNEVLDIYKKYKVSRMFKMSSSLKFCALAAGEADIYAANARAYEWDIAAGHAILEHAGGHMTTHEEKKIFYGKDNYKNLSILAKRANNLEK